MREIVLDTETTGLDPQKGDRLVEIGCVELVNLIATGKTWHRYFNPQRDMPDGAFQVHGLSEEFLADKPLFAQESDEFLAFVGDAQLVIHNAEFDMRFLNAELARIGKPLLDMARVTDTLALARRRFPGMPNNLDALSARLGVDTSKRSKHGALIDAEILADVYAELTGKRQTALGLASVVQAAVQVGTARRSEPLPSRLTEAERAAHAAFIAEMGATALWRQYLDT
ncbi:MAG: DNA polymerase III subunit epsilon [Hyphomicrobiales bacterium]|nr:DNA polymerase III subunit epsilon [Hyphomicrobiales bacterium]